MASTSIKIRFAHNRDGPALERLAELDSAHRPEGPALVAEVGGRAVAALALRDGRVVADPFEHTAAAVALLRERADQLTVGARRPRGRLGAALAWHRSRHA